MYHYRQAFSLVADDEQNDCAAQCEQGSAEVNAASEDTGQQQHWTHWTCGDLVVTSVGSIPELRRTSSTQCQ